eukprot:766195-Hanusia_phi.AAC.1
MYKGRVADISFFREVFCIFSNTLAADPRSSRYVKPQFEGYNSTLGSWSPYKGHLWVGEVNELNGWVPELEKGCGAAVEMGCKHQGVDQMTRAGNSSQLAAPQLVTRSDSRHRSSLGLE